jgi:hypothetical protein
MACASSVPPHIQPPMAQVPRPMRELLMPELPSVMLSMRFSLPPVKGYGAVRGGKGCVRRRLACGDRDRIGVGIMVGIAGQLQGAQFDF